MGSSENQIRDFDSFSKALYDLPGFSMASMSREIPSLNHPNTYRINCDDRGNHELEFYITPREAAAVYVQWKTTNLDQTGFKYFITVYSGVPNPMEEEPFISLQHEARKNPELLRVGIFDDVNCDEDEPGQPSQITSSDDSSQHYPTPSILQILTETTYSAQFGLLLNEDCLTAHSRKTEEPEPSVSWEFISRDAGRKPDRQYQSLSPARRLEIEMWNKSIPTASPSTKIDEREAKLTATYHTASADHRDDISEGTSDSGIVIYTQQENEEEFDADDECESSLWRSPYSRRGWLFWPEDPENPSLETDAIGGDPDEEDHFSLNHEVLDISHGPPEECLCEECKKLLWRHLASANAWIFLSEDRKYCVFEIGVIGGP